MNRIQNIKAIILTLAAAAVIASCKSDKYPEPNFVSDYAALTLKGKAIMDYNAFLQQISVNEDDGKYSLFSDTCSEYFDLDLNYFPFEEGQTVKGSIHWKAGSSEKEFDKVTFRVASVGDDGTIKLWDSKNGIGVIMRTRP